MKIVKLLGEASEDQAPLTSLRKTIEEFFQPKTMHGLVISTTFKKLSCIQLANLLDMHDCVSKETGVLKEDVDLLVTSSSLGLGVQVSRSDSHENTSPSSFEVSICRVASVSDGSGPLIGSSIGSGTGGDIYDIMDEAAFDQVEENHSLLAQAQKEAEAAAREIEDDAILQEVMASSSTTQHKGATAISKEQTLNQQAKTKRSDKNASTEALVTYILENVDLETLFSTAIRPDGQWMSPLEMKAHIIGTYNIQMNLKAAQGILKVLRELKGYNTASDVVGDANIEDDDVSMALAMSLSLETVDRGGSDDLPDLVAEVPLETRSTDMNEDDQLALALSLSMAN